jgi:transcriptional regulator with XRE-family HTH domain
LTCIGGYGEVKSVTGRAVAPIFLDMAGPKMTGIKSVEITALRMALLEEGWSVADLAKRCGIPRGSLSTWMCAGCPTARPRYLIEAAFAYRRPIWSTPAELESRRHCLEVFGFDPHLKAVRELKQLGPDIGADFSNCTNQAAMVREVFARAAVTRKPVNPIKQ